MGTPPPAPRPPQGEALFPTWPTSGVSGPKAQQRWAPDSPMARMLPPGLLGPWEEGGQGPGPLCWREEGPGAWTPGFEGGGAGGLDPWV